MDTDHSNYYNKIIKKEYVNLADITEEVDNYKSFREHLINFLNKYPYIKCNNFKKKGIKLHYKNECNFEIKDNMFKNIYYSWRKSSNSHNIFSLFLNNKTLNNKNYLRDYAYSFEYNNKGNKQFVHEHAIFISDYFIKKLRFSYHWYIVWYM